MLYSVSGPSLFNRTNDSKCGFGSSNSGQETWIGLTLHRELEISSIVQRLLAPQERFCPVNLLSISSCKYIYSSLCVYSCVRALCVHFSVRIMAEIITSVNITLYYYFKSVKNRARFLHKSAETTAVLSCIRKILNKFCITKFAVSQLVL